jgi:hypothetical protein
MADKAFYEDYAEGEEMRLKIITGCQVRTDERADEAIMISIQYFDTPEDFENGKQSGIHFMVSLEIAESISQGIRKGVRAHYKEVERHSKRIH